MSNRPVAPLGVYLKRRNTELALCLLASLLGIGGFLITNLNRTGHLPDAWPPICLGWVAVCVAAHLLVRWRLPYADPILLPTVLGLNGLGLAMIWRLDQDPPASHMASTQALWTVLGVALFAAVLIWLPDFRVLRRYPYLFFLAGLVLLMLPLLPGLGAAANQANGSRVWISLFGLSFQPAEIAKIALALSFASYLVDHRDVLRLAGRRIAGVRTVRLRDFAPVLVMWGAGVIVLVFENDLGTSLLFFGLFVMMLYVATEQTRWVAMAGVLFLVAGFAAYEFIPHVRVRFDSWLNPFADRTQNGQIIASQYGLAWGGLFGTGWGLGQPNLVPLAQSDFIASSLTEELGLTGLFALILIYAFIVARGLRAGLTSRDDFGKLLASGLSFTFALQVFAIIGGVTRLLPLTGLTTPFMSQGGSSLVANWAIVAVLLVISHEGRRPLPAPAPVMADLTSEATMQLPQVGVG